MGYSLFFLLLSLLVFGLIYRRERRSIFIAIWAFLPFLPAFTFLLATGILETMEVVRLLAIVVAMLLIFLFLSGPFLFLITLYYTGFQLLKREGMRLTNFLSLGLAVAITLYLFLFPFVSTSLSHLTLFEYLFVYFGLLLTYIVGISMLYTLSSFINLINLFPPRLDYIVVLGAGLNGEQVTPLLASRIDKGIALYKKHAGSRLIMSGGQGEDEVLPEAEAMANYAVKQGVPREDIVLENQSRNTEENLQFSQALMSAGAQFALVTNDYHVFRALLLARKLRIRCIGYGAKTKFYFSMNAFIREFVGYLVMSRRFHLVVLGVASLLYLVVGIISYLIPF